MIKVKNLVLGIGIFVVYALMLWQGIEAFYPSPQYGDFCSGDNYYPRPYPLGSGENCTALPGIAEAERQCNEQGGFISVTEYSDAGCALAVECNFCQKEYDEARTDYSKIIFIIGLIVGIITLIIGYAVLAAEPVGSALIASGIWAIFYGAAWNWRNFSNVWRFLLLLLALVLLIWITLKLNQDKKKGFFGKLFRK